MATKPTTRAADEEPPIVPTGPQSGPFSPFASMPHPATEVWIEETLNPPEVPPPVEPPPETTMGVQKETVGGHGGKDHVEHKENKR